MHGPAEGALPPGAGCAVRAPAAGSRTYAAALTGTALPLRNQVCLRGHHKLAGIDKPGDALKRIVQSNVGSLHLKQAMH